MAPLPDDIKRERQAWHNRRITLQTLLVADIAGIGYLFWRMPEGGYEWPMATVLMAMVGVALFMLILYFTQVTSHERLQALLSAGFEGFAKVKEALDGPGHGFPRFPGFGRRDEGPPSP